MLGSTVEHGEAGPGRDTAAGRWQTRMRHGWAHPEVVAASVAMLVVAATLLVVVLHLRAVPIDPACLPVAAAAERSGWCLNHGLGRLSEVISGEVRLLRIAMLGLPILVGALLGSPIVARSIEQGRFRLDWATPPARARRLVARSWRRTLLLVLGLGVSGWLAAEAQWLTTPWLPSGDATLDTLGTWGPVVPARGLLVLSLAVLVGAIVGHRLAAGAIGLALGAVLVLGGTAVVRDVWLDGYPAVPRATLGPGPGAVLTLHGRGYQNQYGRIWSEAEAIRIAQSDPAGRKRVDAWLAEHYEEVPLAIPIPALPELQRTELLVTLGAAAVLAGAAGVAVTLRRPRG